MRTIVKKQVLLNAFAVFFVVICSYSVAFSGPLADEPKVPFTDYLDSFLKSNGHTGIELNDKALMTVLEDNYVAIGLGAFDVWYPQVFLKKADGLKQFKAVASALLDMQEVWLSWAIQKGEISDPLKEMKVLRKWIKSWRSYKIKRKNGQGRPDLCDLFQVKDKIRGAVNGFSAFMTKGGYLNSSLNAEKKVFLIISPTRGDLLGLGSFIGALNEENKRFLWNDGLALWTSFNREDIHVIALQHPASFPGQGNITLGLDMNSKEKTGLLQHVVQNATELLLAHYYKQNLPQELVNGLAMNIVIDLYDENNVRAGGGSQGKKTAAFSKFVAGGASSGGVLPGRSAENRWRKNGGKDHFLNALRVAQSDGARDSKKSKGKARDKRLYFSLKSDSGAMGYSVNAPFFKVRDDVKPLPADYVNDFQEFFRAYRCAFAFWLKTAAKSKIKKESTHEVFRKLFQTAAGDSDTDDMVKFLDAVEDLYGIPFSGDSGSEESLELRFLDWLSKGK